MTIDIHFLCPPSFVLVPVELIILHIFHLAPTLNPEPLALSTTTIPAMTTTPTPQLPTLGIPSATTLRAPSRPFPIGSPIILLCVPVLECMNLSAKDKNGLRDPFVIVSLLGDRYQTPVVKKCLSTVYAPKDATFDFPIYLSLPNHAAVSVISPHLTSRSLSPLLAHSPLATISPLAHFHYHRRRPLTHPLTLSSRAGRR
ncbi:uncharacterized protein FIBRA_08683 [Fibroporia radiculosa]|uniref:C2 domain-containing protein n=1 Tax=Fibroporia radiculosa TaxID=599839 RepID=J4I362_9APHY|nr:uncharacterized protein FIBRA_08683 [Fibroporia radiculosa]CCM06422.1 predicted protein [Fibroporia radiculosa]